MEENKFPTLEQLRRALFRGKTELDTAISNLNNIRTTIITTILPASSWSNKTQTITHASLSANGRYFYIVGADADEEVGYSNAGVKAGNVVTDGQMIFQCEVVPNVDLTVYILRLEVGENEQ